MEAALTLHALAEVDPTCVGGLVSYGLTTLQALRETVSFDKVYYFILVTSLSWLLSTLVKLCCIEACIGGYTETAT